MNYLLLQPGLSVEYERHAMWRAVYAGHVNVIEALLRHGLPASDIIWEMRPALYWLARYGHHEVVEKLLDFGADVYGTSYRGPLNPVIAAREQGFDAYRNYWCSMRRGERLFAPRPP